METENSGYKEAFPGWITELVFRELVEVVVTEYIRNSEINCYSLYLRHSWEWLVAAVPQAMAYTSRTQATTSEQAANPETIKCIL